MNNKDRMVDFFKKNILVIILVIVCLSYLFIDFFNFKFSFNFTWYELIGIFTINFGFGYAITDLMNDNGIKAGYNSEKYKVALNTYGQEKVKTDSFNEFAGEFCARYNEKTHRQTLIDYYMSYDLSYDKLQQGKYNINELTKTQQKAIKNVNKRIKEMPITPKYMYSLSSHSYRSKKFTEDVETHIAKRMTKNLISKIIFSITFTLMAFEFVSNPSWSNLLSSLLKVATWLAIGGIGYFKEYTFITQDYLQNVVIDKTDLLVQFRNEYSKGAFTKVEVKNEISNIIQQQEGN